MQCCFAQIMTTFVMTFLFVAHPGLIHHIKIHEGKQRLAVCVQLPSSRSSSLGGSRWILYSVQDLNGLAKLYATMKLAMTRSRAT